MKNKKNADDNKTDGLIDTDGTGGIIRGMLLLIVPAGLNNEMKGFLHIRQKRHFRNKIKISKKKKTQTCWR